MLYLQRCIDLALKADSRTFPNPKVGAVIVYDDKIIGEGYHEYAGGPHAEVNAVNSVKDKELLPFSTIYVSLEPCNHFGKTPPCVNLMLEHKIPKVVVGCLDPNPQVAGKGIARLREQGVEVVLAENSSDFQAINQVFFCNQLEKRPYVVLKWAESQDGFISPSPPLPYPISDRENSLFVHQLRAKHHAIMIGANTARIDNPQLTVRKAVGKSPIRIVWDKHLRLPQDLQLFTDGHETIVLNSLRNDEVGKLRFYVPSDEQAWENMQIMAKGLFQDLGICSILVEGGRGVLQQFIDAKCYDEVHRFVGKMRFGGGIAAPHFAQINADDSR